MHVALSSLRNVSFFWTFSDVASEVATTANHCWVLKIEREPVSNVIQSDLKSSFDHFITIQKIGN
jgi:hypothetical protein